MSSLVDWEDALRDDLARLSPMPVRKLPVHEALGTALAETLAAPEALPAFDNSAMDGFAVRAGDIAGATPETPVTLPAGESLPAGAVSQERLRPGSAARIMTGAPLPQGADAVIPVEYTDAWDADAGRIREESTGAITFFSAVLKGQHIRRAGESVALGETILEPGHVLGGPELALLLSLGIELVNVYSPPTVAVLATGDELVPASLSPGPGHIRDSNRPGLQALLRQLGFPTVDLGLVQDDPAQLESRIQENRDRFDFLLTSGGVSVGDHDFTRDVLNKLGSVTPRTVAMKPGKPQVVGTVFGKPVFGLPGNPVSSLVVFDVFVLPALRTLAGHREPLVPRFNAEITSAVRHTPGRTEFLRVRLTSPEGQWRATPTGPQGSGILTSMTRSNGYALLSKEAGDLDSGVQVVCMPMATRF